MNPHARQVSGVLVLNSESRAGQVGVLSLLLAVSACGGGGSALPPALTVPVWGTAQVIETNNLDSANDPRIVVDATGNALAVWVQRVSSGRPDIWANRYSATTGLWGAPELIETDNTGAGGARIPQVAMDTTGNAIAVWYQHDGARYNIWANRFNAATGTWGTAELIETDNLGSAYSPEIAVDTAGNAIAVWYQHDGMRNNIWANRYVAASGTWGTAELIETDNTGDTYDPDIGFDAAGNAYAVWNQFDGTYQRAMANRYTAGTGWDVAAAIETGTGDTYYNRIAVNGAGDAVTVWLQHDGNRYQVWGNRYTASTGWGTAEPIENGSGDVDEVQIVTDAAGNALVVWRQFGTGANDIWANRYTAGQGWGLAVQIENASGDASQPQIAIDASGNAIAVWRQFDGTRDNIWSSRYIVSGGWGSAQLVETDDTSSADSPQIAFGPAGTAIAVWSQDSASRTSIWTNTYR
jgi:hypothetical protein